VQVSRDAGQIKKWRRGSPAQKDSAVQNGIVEKWK
jgi:hypothetical protein